MREETTPRAAAFFDLDRTIISGSSVFTFGYVAYTHGLLPRAELMKDLSSALIFKFAGASDEKSEAVKNRILDSIRGTKVDDLRHLGGEIIPRLLDGVRRESRGLIDLHHDAGRDTYIVSASPIEIISDFAAAMGMTGALGTVAEVVDGMYTGELAEPFCYGEGKAIAIEKLAAEKGYDLALCYSYSDSGSDLPMLESVGVWPLRGGGTERRMRPRTTVAATASETTALQLSPDGEAVAVGYSDGTVRLWPVAGREPLLEEERVALSGHRSAVLCLAFAPDGSQLASGGADTLVQAAIHRVTK